MQADEAFDEFAGNFWNSIHKLLTKPMEMSELNEIGDEIMQTNLLSLEQVETMLARGIILPTWEELSEAQKIAFYNYIMQSDALDETMIVVGHIGKARRG